MRKHAYEFYPRINLTVSQFAINIAKGNNAHTTTTQRGISFAQRQRSIVQAFFHLVDVCECFALQQCGGRLVMLQNMAKIIYH